MKRKLFLSLAAVLMAAFAIKAQIPSDEQLRRYAAQMLMVGFKGNTVDAESDAARYIRDLKVGSIVLFDIDLTGTAKLGSRNITRTSSSPNSQPTYKPLPTILCLSPPTRKVVVCSV